VRLRSTLDRFLTGAALILDRSLALAALIVDRSLALAALIVCYIAAETCLRATCIQYDVVQSASVRSIDKLTANPDFLQVGQDRPNRRFGRG